jgi:S-phase kinase-associated protein 1
MEDSNVTILSKEGDSFTITRQQAELSELLKPFIAEGSGDEPVPVPDVSSKVIKYIIQFMENYVADPMKDIEKPLKSTVMKEVVQEWYAEFVEGADKDMFELILGANFMDIKPLLELTCAYTASKIKGKSPEEIRKIFDVTNDFTPEEEAQIREENKWCEEY